jgi:hypothetical protein
MVYKSPLGGTSRIAREFANKRAPNPKTTLTQKSSRARAREDARAGFGLDRQPDRPVWAQDNAFQRFRARLRTPLEERVASGCWRLYSSIIGFLVGDPIPNRLAIAAAVRRAIEGAERAASLAAAAVLPKGKKPRGRPKVVIAAPSIAPSADPATNPADRALAIEGDILDWCRERGVTLRGEDQCISEPDLARMFGWSESTLRHRRYDSGAPPHRTRPRVGYPVRPLAEWIAERETHKT